MKPPSVQLRQKWLVAALPQVCETGWTAYTLRKSAEAAGLSAGEQALAAPHGVEDLMNQFFEDAQLEAREILETKDLSALRTHEKVADGLKVWLSVLEPHREAVRRAVGRGLAPWNAGSALKRLWSVADMVWTLAGDTAIDYNRYSKRTLLSGVIMPVLMGWIDGIEGEALDALIERHLQRAMKLGQAGGKVLGPVLNRVWPGKA